MTTLLHTRFCAQLGVDLPILVAPFGPWDEVELAVAAASAGCLASLGTATRSAHELEQQWTTVRERTDRPFVINHTGPPFNPEAFAARSWGARLLDLDQRGGLCASFKGATGACFC